MGTTVWASTGKMGDARDKGLWDGGAVGTGNARRGIQVGDVEGMGDV